MDSVSVQVPVAHDQEDTVVVSLQLLAVAQALLQQTLSTQKPLEHIEAAPSEANFRLLVEHVEPLVALATQDPEALQ